MCPSPCPACPPTPGWRSPYTSGTPPPSPRPGWLNSFPQNTGAMSLLLVSSIHIQCIQLSSMLCRCVENAGNRTPANATKPVPSAPSAGVRDSLRRSVSAPRKAKASRLPRYHAEEEPMLRLLPFAKSQANTTRPHFSDVIFTIYIVYLI